MIIKRLTIISTLIFLNLISTIQGFGQQRHDKEYLFGVNINSRSFFIGALDLKIKNKKSGFMDFGVANIKHPNEIRFIPGVTNNNQLGNRAILLGKTNYLISFRGQYGVEKRIFEPAEYEGVSVAAIFAGGISLGVVKPYYIKYLSGNDKVVSEPYNPNTHDLSRILGPNGIFYGLKGTNIVPGLNAKTGFLFEYHGLKRIKTTIETGAMVEIFAKKIELNPFGKQEFLFTSVYAIISIGKNKKGFK